MTQPATARFDPRYSQRQKNAVAGAAYGAGSAEVRRRARAGELFDEYGSLAPFDIPESSIRSIKRRAPRSVLGVPDRDLTELSLPDAFVRLFWRAALQLDREIAQLERDMYAEDASGVVSSRGARRCSEIAKALRELDKLARWVSIMSEQNNAGHSRPAGSLARAIQDGS